MKLKQLLFLILKDITEFPHFLNTLGLNTLYIDEKIMIYCENLLITLKDKVKASYKNVECKHFEIVILSLKQKLYS